MMSSGRASECSLTINSREDNGILSRRLYPTEFEFIFFITPHFHMPNVFLNFISYSIGTDVCKLNVERIKNINHEIEKVRKSDYTTIVIV